MQIQDAAERPAANDLLNPVVLTLEDDGLPETVQLEGLADVEVRRSAGVSGVLREVGIFIVGTGAVSIQALGPHELRVSGEVVGEGVFQLRKQSVVAGAADVSPEVAARDQRVQRETLNHAGCVGCLVVGQVASRAAFVSERRYEPLMELVLRIDRVVFCVLRGHVAMSIADDRDVGIAGGGQVGRIVGGDGVGVGRIPGQRGRAA